MKLHALAGYVLTTCAALSAGCAILTRVTVAPTLDALGNGGVDVRVTLTPAAAGSQDTRQHTLYGVGTSIGGSYLGTERAGAAQVRVAPEIDVHFTPLYLRFGLGYSGRFTGPLPACASEQGAVGGLQGPMAYLAVDASLRSENWSYGALQFISLGPELTGEYMTSTGPCKLPNRGILSLGLSLTMLFSVL